MSFGSDEGEDYFIIELTEKLQYANEEIQQLKLEVERLKDLLMV
jgi:hypothetical protein